MIAVSILLKATALIALAAAIQAVLHRRTSAATRHLLWTIAVAGLLALPVLSLTLPRWSIEIERAAEAAPAPLPVLPVLEERIPEPTAATTPAPEKGPGLELQHFVVIQDLAPSIALAVYGAGVMVMLVHLGVQRWSVRRLARAATDVRDEEWLSLVNAAAASLGVTRRVALLRSRDRNMPMAFGTRRPAILIPAIADVWPEDRRRAVILHEMAHVARQDCLTQLLAFVASAVYWFHPAVWWVGRRLRIERELACDDLVLAAGAPARDYAGHLLEIAYTLGGHRAPGLAVSMARPRQLEGRMLAVLDAARNRRRPPLRARVAAIATAGALLTAMAAATVTTIAADPQDDPAPTAMMLAPAATQTAAAPKIVSQLKETVKDSARGLVETAKASAAVFQEKTVPEVGSWELQRWKTDGHVNLQMRHGMSTNGFDVALSRLDGLSASHLTGAGGPVKFRLRREAGTFTFEGTVRNGVGGGTFTYAADAGFADALVKRGFARPTEFQQYDMARHDIGFALLDELNRQGYGKPDLAEVIRAGHHGVDADYVREMAEAGYKLGTLTPLIELRDHGVTATYVREMAEFGYKGLPADEIRRARDHGITSEYVRAMRDAGYGSLPLEQIIKARDHGVTAEFVRQLADSGHPKMALDEVIRTRDHGVTPEYMRRMRELGYGSLTMGQLIAARDHGVTPEFVKALTDAGYKNLSIDEVIRVRDHGVSADFARELAAAGHKNVPLPQLVRARDHGVSPDYVAEMRALGYTVSLDDLIRARDHGVTAQFAKEMKTLGYDKVALEDLIILRDHGVTVDRVRRANERAGTRLPLDMLKALAAGGMR